MSARALRAAAVLTACILAGGAALPPPDEVQDALNAVRKALEDAGSAAALFKAHDALWPAVRASVKPLLSPEASSARRRLVAAGAGQFPSLSEATQQYAWKLLQLQSLYAQQAFSHSVTESMLGFLVVNDTALRQTEAAIQRMQDVLGNVTMQLANDSLALASNLMSRARQRAAALNASASPLWSAGQGSDTPAVQPTSAEPTGAPVRRHLSQQQPPLPADDAPPRSAAVEDDTYEDYEYIDADRRRRQLRQADAAIFPPLPPGNPPALDEQLDASYYGEGEDDYSDDPDYYGSELDWLFEDEGDLLGLLLTLPTTRTDANYSPPSSSDVPAPALPVYAVFASSSHGPVVPSTANSSTAEEPVKAKPLELIVAPFGVGAKPPHPAQEKGFDPRWFGLVASLAIIALVVGVLAVWSRSRRSSERRAVEQEEQLLYSHIPGTPKRGGKAGGAASASTMSGSAAWQPGKGGSPAGKAGAPVPKKLSNLPA